MGHACGPTSPEKGAPEVFIVSINSCGERRRIRLKVIGSVGDAGEPVLTIMLAHER